MNQKSQDTHINFGEISIGNGQPLGGPKNQMSAHRDTLPNIASKFEVTKSSSKMFKSPYSSKLQQNNFKYDPAVGPFGNSITNSSNNNNNHA